MLKRMLTYCDMIARESPTFATKTLVSVKRRMIAQEPERSFTDWMFLFMNSASAAMHPLLIAVSMSFGNSD